MPQVTDGSSSPETMVSSVRVISDETGRDLGVFTGVIGDIEGLVWSGGTHMKENDEKFSSRGALDVRLPPGNPQLMNMEQMMYLSTRIRDNGIIDTTPDLIQGAIYMIRKVEEGKHHYNLYLYPQTHQMACARQRVLCGARAGSIRGNDNSCVSPDDVKFCGSDAGSTADGAGKFTPANMQRIGGGARVMQKLSETSSALKDAAIESAANSAMHAASAAYNAAKFETHFLRAVALNLMREQQPDANAEGAEVAHAALAVTMPPLEDEVWRDPVKKMELLQAHLFERYAYAAAVHEDGPRICRELKSSKKLQAFQMAASEPLKYVDNMLVISSTGSGKSALWTSVARSIHDRMVRGHVCLKITIIVKSNTLRQEQYAELVKSPAWADISPGSASLAEGYDPTGEEKVKFHHWKKYVAHNDDRSTRAIRFLTFHQAGNCIRKASPERPALDNNAILVDEIHTLADPVSGASAVSDLFNWLEERKYYKLVGLTATPFVTMSKFVDLLRLFQPEGAKPLTESQMSELFPAMSAIQQNPTMEERDMLEGAESCDITMDGLRIPIDGADIKLYERLRGYNIYMYSTDRDCDVYPIVHADTERCFFVRAPDGKDDKMQTVRWDNKPWTKNSLRHPYRSRAIAVQLAKDLGKHLLTGGALGKKGLVMLTMPSQVDPFVQTLLQQHPDVDNKYDIMPLWNSTNAQRAAGTLAEFNSSPVGKDDLPRLLIADARTWGTGINMLGVRQCHRLPAGTLKEDVQIRGRIRRFCGHDQYQDVQEWRVEMYLWIPESERATPGDASGRSCEQVMVRVIRQAQKFEESLYRALFMASFGRMAFWERRPIFIDEPKVPGREIPGDESADTAPSVESTWGWARSVASASARGILNSVHYVEDTALEYKNRLRDAIVEGFSIPKEELGLWEIDEPMTYRHDEGFRFAGRSPPTSGS